MENKSVPFSRSRPLFSLVPCSRSRRRRKATSRVAAPAGHSGFMIGSATFQGEIEGKVGRPLIGGFRGQLNLSHVLELTVGREKIQSYGAWLWMHQR